MSSIAIMVHPSGEADPSPMPALPSKARLLKGPLTPPSSDPLSSSCASNGTISTVATSTDELTCSESSGPPAAPIVAHEPEGQGTGSTDEMRRRQLPGREGGCMKVRTLEESLRGGAPKGGGSERSSKKMGKGRRPSARTVSTRNLRSTILRAGVEPFLLGPTGNEDCMYPDDEDEKSLGSSGHRWSKLKKCSSHGDVFRPTVTFHAVEVREYDVTVSDNPSVSRGPGLSLGWEYAPTQSVPLERYEALRPPRRAMTEMVVPCREREARLLDSGVTREEMQAAIRKINVARQKRTRTVRMLKNHTVHERIEGATRKFKKMMGMKKSSEREEEDLWENAQAYFSA